MNFRVVLAAMLGYAVGNLPDNSVVWAALKLIFVLSSAVLIITVAWRESPKTSRATNPRERLLELDEQYAGRRLPRRARREWTRLVSELETKQEREELQRRAREIRTSLGSRS